MTLPMTALDIEGYRRAQHSPEQAPKLAQTLSALATAKKILHVEHGGAVELLDV